ncbi:hypothetical protein Aperf_G00000096260 [Anoplocephala perfoliata]
MSDTLLYVGDIHPSATAKDLFNAFSYCGIISPRIMPAKNGHKAGVVRFARKEDADRALRDLQNTTIFNQPLRLMRWQTNPRLRAIKGANVFVKNLDRRISQKELYEYFSDCGEIVSCKLAIEENGISRGYGYVQFKDIASALEAIRRHDQENIRGRVITVKPFKPRKDRYPGDGNFPFNNCYIKNFDGTTTEDDLRNIFSKMGEILNIFMPRNETNLPKGYAFVCFKQFGDAAKAVQNLNGKLFRGRPLYVSRAEKKANRQKALCKFYQELEEASLYVKNLDEAVDENALKAFFNQYGKVIRAKVIRDKDGRSKGFGFVWFATPKELNKVLTMPNRELASRQIIMARAVSRSRITSVWNAPA